MKNRITALFFLLIALLLAACSAPAATVQPTADAMTQEAATGEGGFPVTVTDGLGNQVTVQTKPMHIASVTLGTDETLLELVGTERLLAVTSLASDATTSNIADSPDLAKVQNVIPGNPSAEQIIALNPDLVFVGSFTDPAFIKQLQDAGLTVFVVGNFTSIDAMAQNILTIGKVVGEEPGAHQMVEAMNTRLAAVTDVFQRNQPQKQTVLYYASGGWVAGSATTVDDIITRAGGINAAAQAGINDWQQLSEEALIDMNPNVVILSPYVTDEEFASNPAFADLDVIKNGRFYSITDACMSATSQYIVCGVEDAAHVIYPELFGE